MSETTYLTLSKYLPPSDEDTRSVHFVSFPLVNSDYFNIDVERAVSRMQTVIDLGRFIRDQKTIPLKFPCRDLIIINADIQFHSDIKSLESYIQEELNVRNVIITSEEDQYGVNYKLLPDAKALGVKFKRDASKIRNALNSVSKKDIKQFTLSGTIEIAGFTLTTEELQVTRTFDSQNPNYAAHFTNEVLVILDIEKDQNLFDEGLAREVMNRIQRLRKKAGLQQTDDILYHYELKEDESGQLKDAFSTQREFLVRNLKQSFIPEKKASESLIMAEEQEVLGSKFNLSLYRH
jgi:isoleucyl-tRNA synthetase